MGEGGFRNKEKEKKSGKSEESKPQRGVSREEQRMQIQKVKDREEEGSTVSTEKAMAVCNNKQCVRRQMFFYQNILTSYWSIVMKP